MIAGTPATALDPVSTAIVVGAVANLGATVLDRGLPALQADRQRQEYIFETVEHLQYGQIAIRQGQAELARKLDELGKRVPKELRAELDVLVEDEVTGAAKRLISDVKLAANGGNPLVSPGIRLNAMQTAIGTYMERRSADVGLGLAGWALTVELAFMEATRGTLINEYKRRTGRQLDSIEESYHSRVGDYFAYFRRAFDPEERGSVRARLDRERAALDAALQVLNEAIPKLEAAIRGLPSPKSLDEWTRNQSLYDDRGKCGFGHPRSFYSVLHKFVADDASANEQKEIINNVIAPAQHHAEVSQLLTAELKRARRLFEGLRSVQLEAERMRGKTVGLGIKDEMLEALKLPATLEDEAIARARAAVELARTKQEAMGTTDIAGKDERRRLEEAHDILCRMALRHLLGREAGKKD